MFYILHDNREQLFISEINREKGTTVYFKRGYFLYHLKNEKDIYISWYDNEKTITINDIDFVINDQLKFKNEIKAELIFLRLKIDELKDNNFNEVLPKSFKKYTQKFNKLKKLYPEYLL